MNQASASLATIAAQLRSQATRSGGQVAAAFVCWLVSACVAGAAVAWPIWLLLQMPWDKVLSRSVLLCAALLLWPLIRWLRLDRSAIFGASWNRADFLRYWCLGLLLIVPPAMVFLATGFRVFDSTWQNELDDLGRAMVGGLVGGVLAALFEEAIFRGVLLVALSRVMHLAFAIGISSALYALCHFLAADFELTAPTPGSGFIALQAAFMPLLEPAQWWDSFLGLFALGVLLCLVRLRTAMLMPCVALHAAWIFFLRIYKEMTGRDVHSEFSWLVGEHDNFTGVVVAAWLVVLIVCYSLYRPGQSVR